MAEEWGPRRGPRRNKQWTTVTHGVHRPVAQVDQPHGDLPAWQLVLPPTAAFTHLTAAGVYGWWLPPLPPHLPVFARQSVHEPRRRRAGLRVTRHPQPVATRVEHGLRVVTPAEVLLACGRDLGLLDMAVLIDGALHRGSCTEREVADVAAGRRAGSPRLRRALAYADGRSESPWESMLRMLHVACDVPVEPQHRVFDPHGRFVARGDLWIKGTRVLHEYDGGEHLKRPRQRTDLRRGRDLANVGWVRRGYTSQEVLHQAVGILRDADMSLGRPHRPERIRAWHALLADSLFTPRGTARLQQRLGLQSAQEWSRNELRRSLNVDS